MKMAEEQSKKTYWGNKVSYLLSIIGFVIGLGNFWLFPTRCFQNGGAVFLIPYALFMLLLGIPIVYLELLLGQVLKTANLGLYEQLCPALKGTAYSVITMNLIRQTYYNTVIAWALSLLFASFNTVLPWEADISAINSSSNMSLTNVYFVREVLGKHGSSGIHDLGGLQPSLIPNLILVFIVVYLIIRHGAASIGPSAYVTAILPYVLLITLLIKACTLEGALQGLKRLFQPDVSKLKTLDTWKLAAIQICYSLGPGAGVLVAYASYSDNENMNIKLYSVVVVVCNAVTSLLCGIVLFCGLGFLQHTTSVNFDDFLQLGDAIIFVIYPIIISRFKGGFAFSIAFFLMIFMIGLNSVYAEIEGMYAALRDRFISLRHNQERNKLVILIICFFLSLPSVTFGGDYVVTFLVEYGIAPAVLLILAIEAITATWIFGYDNLLQKIKEYSDANNPGILIKWCWKVVVPLISLTLYFASYTNIWKLEGSTIGLYGPRHVTATAKKAGVSLSVLILLPIPVYAIFYFVRKCINKKKSKISI